MTPPKQAVIVPRAMHITGDKSAARPFSTPTIVYKPIPIVSNKKRDFLMYFNRLTNTIAKTTVIKMIKICKGAFNHPTGLIPINKSRNVPPPTAVTNAIIKTPKTSNFFSMATNTPEIAKAIVPKISIMK